MSDWQCAALGGPVSPAHLDGGGHHEVLLLQPELLALEEVVVGVEDAGYVLGHVAVQHRLDVVAVVDWPTKQRDTIRRAAALVPTDRRRNTHRYGFNPILGGYSMTFYHLLDYK